MTLPRRPFMALLVVTVAGCGGSATASTSASATQVATGDDLDDLRAALADLVIPSADGDPLRDRLAEAIDLRGALGEEADAILQLIADGERVAYPGTPELEMPTSGVDPSAVTVAYLQAIPLPPGAPPPTLELMILLPGLLDAVGRPGPGTTTMEPDEATATTKGGGMTATTTITTSGSATITGSLVRLEIRRETTSRVVVDRTGEVVLEATDSHTAVADVDVCPTVAGASIASLEQTIAKETTTHAGSQLRVGTHSTASIHGLSRFRGEVDDSAALGQVTQDYSHEEEWLRTAAAEDGPEARREGSVDVAFTGIGVGVPSEHGFAPRIGDTSALGGTVETTGDATQDMVTSTFLSAAWDYAAMDQAYVAAQTLWRNSRCVIVAVPEYEAISELEVQLQGHVDHTESVAAGSETPFIADVQHRFGPNVDASIEATLGGDESLEPESIERPPGTLTYTAPDEEGSTATVRMESTSKQGIGILAIGFETGVEGYEVTIVRKTSGGPWDPTTLTLSATIKPGDDEGVFEGTGRASGTLLEFDFSSSSCRQAQYSGETTIVAQLVGDNLVTYPQLTEPFIIEAGILSGEGREAGGTTRQEREPELGPGEPPPVGATCYAYSEITQTITVKPLAPAP